MNQTHPHDLKKNYPDEEFLQANFPVTNDSGNRIVYSN
jgi:hypothetical protein